MSINQEAVSIVTTIGRYVNGDAFTRKEKDYEGNAYEPGKGPFGFGFAVEKANPEVKALFDLIWNQVATGYQQFPGIVQRAQEEAAGGFRNGNFRFKIKDGDEPNAKGEVNPNTKGHWVFYVSNNFAIKASHFGMQIMNAMGQPVANNEEINPDYIKRGYFVDLALSVKVNGKTDKQAGVYLNVGAIRLRGVGPVIESSGLDTAQVFGANAASAYTPAGMQVGGALPAIGGTAPAATPAAGGVMGGAPAATGGTMGFPAPNAAAAPAPAGFPNASPTVSPHTGFVPGVGMPGQ